MSKIMNSKRSVRPDSKVPELCKLLYQLALEKGPQAKLPKAKELCQMFATTIATLNEALYVLEEKHIIYRRQGSGIFVSPRIHRKSICVLLYSRLFLTEGVSPFWGIFWSLLVQEIEKRMASGTQYYSLHFVMRPREDEQPLSPGEPSLPEDVIRMVTTGQVHAILSVGMENQTYQWLQSMNIPSVTYAGLGSVTVSGDPEKDLQLAVSALVEQGCQTIGFWTTPLSTETPNTYYDMLSTYFSNALTTAQRTYYPEFVHNGTPVAPVTPDLLPSTYQQQGYLLAQKVFGQTGKPQPDGIYIADDMMANGALIALRKMGIRIGETMQIASYANAGSPMLFGETDVLTRIQYEPREIVQALFTELDQLIQGRTPTSQNICVKPRLIKPDLENRT